MPDAVAPPLLIERVDASTFEATFPLIAEYQRRYGREPDDNRSAQARYDRFLIEAAAPGGPSTSIHSSHSLSTKGEQ